MSQVPDVPSDLDLREPLDLQIFLAGSSAHVTVIKLHLMKSSRALLTEGGDLSLYQAEFDAAMLELKALEDLFEQEVAVIEKRRREADDHAQ